MEMHLTRPTAATLRSAAGLLALSGVVISSLGIVILPETSRDSVGAFPCQGGQCGCASAAQCWQSCCCTSPSQRLAWAQAHDVTPPPSLVKLLAKPPERLPVTRSATCCSSPDVHGGPAEGCGSEGDFESSARVVLASDLNRCRGLSRYLAIFGSAICEPLPATLSLDFAPISWLETLDESFDSRLPSPPTPPPRVMV